MYKCMTMVCIIGFRFNFGFEYMYLTYFLLDQLGE